MIRKKFLYSAAILASALQVCSVSPSLAMDYPVYDKSGNAVGTLGVKRRNQDVLEFTLKSYQTRDYVGFENPEIFLDGTSSQAPVRERWKLDVDRQTRTASLDLSKDIFLYRSGYYSPNRFRLGGYGWYEGASLNMIFSDGNFVRPIELSSMVVDKKNVTMTLGAFLAEPLCPQKMSKRAVKKAKREAQAEKRASREVSPLISDEEEGVRNGQATKAKKALKNYRIRQQRKGR